MPARTVRSLLAASFAVSALAGCVSQPTFVDRNVSAAQLADKALIVVSASHDRQAGPGAIAIFYLDAKTKMTRVSSVTNPLDPAVSNDYPDKFGHVYVLEVTPGHHEVSNWVMLVGAKSAHAPMMQAPLGFDVAKGEVLYLGDLDLRVQVAKPGAGPDRAGVDVVDRSATDIPIATAANPAIAGKVRVALLPLGPWREAAEH